VVNRTVKRILIAVIALVVVIGGGTLLYTKVINKADKEFSQSDVDARLDATTTTPGNTAGTTTGSADGVDGEWQIGGESEVGYRVNETINLVDTTANGRTTSITGSLTIAGTTATAGEFTVDMATFTSPESRRDSQFRGRIMEVDKFPTATFTLTAPLDFVQIPAEGGTVTVPATGDLTLHGVTKSVTFDVQATFKNGRIGVLGQIPVTFADYDIANPSFASVTTEDHGLLEFVLVFVRA
jgi:polyisoprenoid-binding protein YceI